MAWTDAGDDGQLTRLWEDIEEKAGEYLAGGITHRPVARRALARVGAVIAGFVEEGDAAGGP